MEDGSPAGVDLTIFNSIEQISSITHVLIINILTTSLYLLSLLLEYPLYILDSHKQYDLLFNCTI